MYKSEALVRACKYALLPNKLGYCGASDFSKSYLSFIENPVQEEATKIEATLKSFRAMYSYLKLIASHNDSEPFSKDVVEAYWLGNSLLENVPVEAVKDMIKRDFIEIPAEQREKKATFLKSNVLVQHSFHVLYVNFLNPKVKPVCKNMDMCIVKYGKVIDFSEKKVKTKSISLKYALGEIKVIEKVLLLGNPFNYCLKKGALVSIHWGSIIEPIDEERSKWIKKAVLKNVALANSYSDV
ncbi:MAG: DUF6390 family protein [Candidatus Diapherotrites archaeon]